MAENKIPLKANDNGHTHPNNNNNNTPSKPTTTTTFAPASISDLSGLPNPLSPSDNPYDALITACNNDPDDIKARYALHRNTRNAQQKEKLLSPDFTSVTIDPILARLVDASIEPGFQDPRHCFVLWARPPQGIRELARKVQEQLSSVAPNLWRMPTPNMHMTVLEITHSQTAPVIASLVDTLRPHLTPIVDYPCKHRTLLVKPLLSYDASALALSFVPAAAAPVLSTDEDIKTLSEQNPAYTYHHLRRDIFSLCRDAGMQVDSRYVVPSAHITLSRFVTTRDFEDGEGKYDATRMQAFVEKIEEINGWLQENYWDGAEHETEWMVGEKGLDCRAGTLWYGDGETVQLGKGF